LHVKKLEIEISLKEIKRVLKNGGIFGLGLIEGNVEEYRESSGVEKPRLFSFYTKNEAENLLNKNGFEVFYFEEFKHKTKKYLNFICRKV
jgi:ubiquinone/menaquinone biosynthesis C-methylase UbiE